MSGKGRPVRFLAVVLGGWTAVRVVMLWPSTGSAVDTTDTALPAAFARAGHAGIAKPTARPVERTTPATPAADKATPAIGERAPAAFGPRKPEVHRTALAPISVAPVAGDEHARFPMAAVSPSLPPAPRVGVKSRWSGSGWLVVRGQGQAGTAFGGSQLGGSQTGLRLAYTIDRTNRIAAVARLSTPLSNHGREAAIGLEWQPTSLPVRIVAEKRVALDRGRSGSTIGVIGGFGPASATPDVTVEAYVQAGAIMHDRAEIFADGAARVAHPLLDIDRTRVDLGLGAWGAAQRDAARLDIGPSLSVDLPLGEDAHVRLSLDWRARVAGSAQPGSGLALALGTDF